MISEQSLIIFALRQICKTSHLSKHGSMPLSRYNTSFYPFHGSLHHINSRSLNSSSCRAPDEVAAPTTPINRTKTDRAVNLMTTILPLVEAVNSHGKRTSHPRWISLLRQVDLSRPAPVLNSDNKLPNPTQIFRAQQDTNQVLARASRTSNPALNNINLHLNQEHSPFPHLQRQATSSVKILGSILP